MTEKYKQPYAWKVLQKQYEATNNIAENSAELKSRRNDQPVNLALTSLSVARDCVVPRYYEPRHFNFKSVFYRISYTAEVNSQRNNKTLVNQTKDIFETRQLSQSPLLHKFIYLEGELL